jgi:hypothetical protein
MPRQCRRRHHYHHPRRWIVGIIIIISTLFPHFDYDHQGGITAS